MDTITNTIVSAIDTVKELVQPTPAPAPVPEPVQVPIEEDTTPEVQVQEQEQQPQTKPRVKLQKPKHHHTGIYSPVLITKTIPVNIINIGNKLFSIVLFPIPEKLTNLSKFF